MRSASRLARVAGPAVDGPHFSVLSDLSANVFAALLLILIVLLQVHVTAERAGRPSTPPPPRHFDAAAGLGATEHRALDPAGLVDLLRRRGPDQRGLSFDVADRGLGLPGLGPEPERWIKGEEIGPVLDGALGRGGDRVPVRLYVFSNRWFADVTAALRRHGFAWTDLSIPRALRVAADGDRWSPEFLALVAAPGSDAMFRERLARLLATSAAPLAPGGHVAGGASGTSDDAAAKFVDSTAGGGMLHRIGAMFGGVAILCGLATVVAIEYGMSRRGGRPTVGPPP